MKSKYEFYEIVKIISKARHNRKIYGRTGFISGKSEEDDGTFAGAYSVSFPELTYSVFEDEIESTGKFANPEEHKPVDSVRVRVLPDGSGQIVDKD